MKETAASARDDLAFVRALVSDGGQIQASTGATMLGGGLCYGAQCLAQGLPLQVPASFPGRNLAELLSAALPTLVFVVLVTRTWVRNRRDHAGAGHGVASRALRTAFGSVALSVLVTATVFGYVAVRDRNLVIWLFHPIMVCVALGVGWYMAFSIRRRAWFGAVAASWFATALGLATLLHHLASFTFVLAAALFGLMAVPGWALRRPARG